MLIFFLGYDDGDEVPIFGLNSIVPKEHGGKFFSLPIIGYLENEVGAVATWDSSIHDSLCLNRVTPSKRLGKNWYSKIYMSVLWHICKSFYNIIQ